jgi:threonine dehydrogenase-like Zn-dependent dehydrogenase
MSTDTPLPAKTARIAVFTGPRKVDFIERSLDAPGPSEALVQTLFSGISHGTEMNVYRGKAPQWSKRYDPTMRLFLPAAPETKVKPARGYWKPSDTHWDYPLAYGYQNVGRVTAIGKDVTDVKEGALVFAYEPHQDMYIAPAASLIKLPELKNPAQGVVYSNINTAYNGVLDADIRLDDVVVIFGLLVTQFVRRSAARKIIVVDPIAARRDMALKLGATAALDPQAGDVALQVREQTDGLGADVTIDVTGSYAALQEAIRAAAPNTTVIVLSWYGGSAEALNLSEEFHHNRITIKCSQVAAVDPGLSATHSVSRRMAHVLEAFDTLEIDPLLTHRLPFTQTASAYDLVDNHSSDVIQVFLDYTG